MTMPPWTLERLAHEWGDAYLLCYCRDRWVALRRDRRYFLVADSLDELERVIRSDYRVRPVPREYDPPGAGDYLDGTDEASGWGPPLPEVAAEQDGDAALDPETRIILRELRELFPYWEITYSAELGIWRAKSKDGSFGEPSIALVWVALAQMERQIDWD
jgi:hypothetical protein